MKIYFAAPLFSATEKQFNLQLAQKLELQGFQVFLPQRDGAERDKEPYSQMPPNQKRRALFELDKTKVLESDIFLFILDGRVPDEGACVELGIAYMDKQTNKPNKLLVGLLTDIRAAFLQVKLNPMLSQALDEVVDSEEQLFERLKSPQPNS